MTSHSNKESFPISYVDSPYRHEFYEGLNDVFRDNWNEVHYRAGKIFENDMSYSSCIVNERLILRFQRSNANHL